MKKTYYKGNGFDITCDDAGRYYMSWEQGPFGMIREYEISKEHADKAKLSSLDAYEVSIYAVTGSWPATEEEMIEATRDFLRKKPELLLKIPDNQKFFCQEELGELIKKVKNGEKEETPSFGTWWEDRKFLRELKKELKKRRVPDYFYSLRRKGRHDERFSIVHLDDGIWEVYYEERGVKTTDRFFKTAEEAGRYMLDELSDME